MDGWKAFDLALAGLCCVLWWMLRSALARLETCVTKDDLTQILRQQAAQYESNAASRERQHEENRQEFRELRKSVQELAVEVAAQVARTDERNDHDSRRPYRG